MDGEADDFMIDEGGNLVPIEEEGEWDLTGLQALAVITQDSEGELSLQIFGVPSQELKNALQTVQKLLHDVGN